jgi:hypothetical protein
VDPCQKFPRIRRLLNILTHACKAETGLKIVVIPLTISGHPYDVLARDNPICIAFITLGMPTNGRQTLVSIWGKYKRGNLDPVNE